MSHISADKVFAAQLKERLSSRAIDAFVAHEDIEPTKEWLGQIESSLSTCDALIAILTEGFHESKWTDQEVGFSVSRRILVIPLRLGLDPYGFISRYQALSPRTIDPTSIAEAIFEILAKNELTRTRLAAAIVRQFSDSDSFAEAKANSRLLERMTSWTPELLREIEQATKKNYQISHSFGVPERVREILRRESGQEETT